VSGTQAASGPQQFAKMATRSRKHNYKDSFEFASSEFNSFGSSVDEIHQQASTYQ
jgi:hypothetical protein